MRGARTEADRLLERLFRAGTVGALTDAQLLERFVAGDDESSGAAFEAIVGRHGPMVLRVCRTVLRDAHAAEDAFQATFLVLARKARTLGERELLGNWLYGVAARTARKAKVAAARRIDRDREAAGRRSIAIDDPMPDGGRDEVGLILHEEIGRLPGSYRAAVVVCYLEGMTQEQAARQLRLAESTVRGRLARARKLLGNRLTRRGVSLSAGLAALGTGADAAAVEAVARLTEATVESLVRSALLFGKSGQATGGAVSATARSLASGVLSTMWLTSIKNIAAAAVALTLAVGGVAVALTHRAAEAQPLQEVALTESGDGIAAPESGPSGAPIAESGAPDPQDPGPGRSKVNSDEDKGRPQSAAVDPALEKAAPGPIVRAVPVSKDCMILAYLPNQNLGHVDNLAMANNHGGVRVLIDWPEIPINEALIPGRLFQIAIYTRKTTWRPPTGSMYVFEVLEDWPEMARWSQMPRYHPDPAMNYPFNSRVGWKLFDITQLVRDQASRKRGSHGVLLRFLSEDFKGTDWSGYEFVSREGAGEWANRRPVLLVMDGLKPQNAPAK